MPRVRDQRHMTDLGNRLRARRQWLGDTLESIGASSGIAWQQVYKYETGQNDPPCATLIRLAKALQTTAGALLGENGTGAPDPREIEAAALLADPSVANILKRLRNMEPPQRKMAHALVCTIQRQQ